jgi:hypothetical protein
MKGDFTRETFNQRDHFNRVLMQQGRVMMDADWNEQEAIEAHLERTEAVDMIGPCGAPMDDAGFEITAQNGKLLIGAGRFYANGILCENEIAPLEFTAQPDFPNPPNPADDLKKTGFAIAYLDVWERHVTALDVPRLREVALNGPDTMTRVRTVWQVKLLPVAFTKVDVSADLKKLADQRQKLQQKLADAQAAGDTATINEINAKLAEIDKAIADLQAKAGDAPHCDTPFAEWDALTAAVKRTLTASTAPVAPNSDPCIVPPAAGYRGLENQLYRIEVHKAGAVGTATFKWSRDNGTVVSLIEKISGKEITVADLGKDDVLTFKAGDWVEISDDALELNGLPGKLYQVDTVKPATRVVVLKTTATKLDNTAPSGVNAALKPKLRKWDQQAGANDQGVLIAATDVLLEDGVQVRFTPNGETFKTGDYWLVPARIATGDIEWPRDTTAQKNYLPQLPLGIAHHFCRLALLTLNPTTGQVEIEDCRDLFPPLTKVCAKPKAMRVVATNWDNDGPGPKDFEKAGFRITLDTPPDPASVNSNSVIVSAEIPFTVNGQVDNTLSQWVTIAGAASIDPLDAKTIVWKIGGNTRAITAVLRILVTLKGALIWNANSTDANRIHLDGQALGVPVKQDNEKRPRTGLQLPSGCCACASDFESWITLGRGQRVDTLIVKEVRIIGRNPASAPETVIGTLPFPPAPPQTPAFTFNAGVVVTAVDVVFNKPVLPDGIVNAPFEKQSIGMEFLAGAAPQRLTGGLTLTDAQTARFNLDPVQRKTGQYRLTVVGVDGTAPFGGPAVRATEDKGLLDGEYDNAAGGNFRLLFSIVGQGVRRAARRGPA